MSAGLRASGLGLIALALCACSHSLRCDSPLRPINTVLQTAAGPIEGGATASAPASRAAAKERVR